MKSHIIFSVIVPVLCLMFFPFKDAVAAPMGTEFTYQGRLIDANEPADGFYDFQFRLFDDPNAGSQQGNTIDINDLDVIDGYFTVELDFGTDAFNGDARWLQISVMPGDSMGRMTILSPRQKVTPTPYALQTRGIFVDSEGDVGIWTTNPQEKLHVTGVARFDLPTGQIHVTAPGGNPGFVAFAPNGNRRDIFNHDDGLLLMTSSSSSAPPSGNGITIRENGSVGIGTMDPKQKLHVSGGSILLDNSYGLFSKDSNLLNRRLLYLNDLDNLVLSNYSAGNIFLGTYTSPGSTLVRLTVTPAGNVGIGTTNPAYKLDVEGTVQAHAYDTGDIFFRKDGQRLWRMFEDEAGLYLENLRTSKVYTFVLKPIREENETKRAVDFDVVIDELKTENESLKQRIEALETMVQQLVDVGKFEL